MSGVCLVQITVIVYRGGMVSPGYLDARLINSTHSETSAAMYVLF